MGLDSVELIMGWEAAFGIRISDDEACAIRTPRMATDLIAAKLGALEQPLKVCPSLRVFNQLRASVVNVTGIDRKRFRPAAQLKDLVSRDEWGAIRADCGIESLPKPGWFSPRTVAELTHWAVFYSLKERSAGEPWTRSEVRAVVRNVVKDVIGVEEFGDDDDFVNDLRVD